MRKAGKEPFPKIYVDGKEENVTYELAAKSQLKKIQKIWVREGFKSVYKNKKEDEDAEKRAKNLEEARKIKLIEDKSLPPATRIRITDGHSYHNKRVKVYGWVHRLRRQGQLKLYIWVFWQCFQFSNVNFLLLGKALTFITLRDGTGFLQCVLTDLLCQSYEALVLANESSVLLYGTLRKLPEGKTVSCTLNFNIRGECISQN